MKRNIFTFPILDMIVAAYSCKGCQANFRLTETVGVRMAQAYNLHCVKQYEEYKKLGKLY